jgi:hypothetical protein
VGPSPTGIQPTWGTHKIAGATGSDVKLRAERKLGGRAEALTPQRLRSLFDRAFAYFIGVILYIFAVAGGFESVST